MPHQVGKSATMTPGERCRNTNLQRLDPIIEELFDKFQDVFSENLDGGKTMQVPMDIVLDEKVADKYRGRYSTSVRKPPICLEKAAAKLMDELIQGGIIAKCVGPGKGPLCNEGRRYKSKTGHRLLPRSKPQLKKG